MQYISFFALARRK